MHFPKALFTCICYSILFAFNLSAQPYSYKHLSSSYYSKQKDSLKKNLICPVSYTQKNTQKQYKEFWTERLDQTCLNIENDNYLYAPAINAYLEGIVQQLCLANKEVIDKKPLVLVDRSSVANAYTPGNYIICVNMGIVDFVETREELAFILAHELSHNILNHAEISMSKKAEWLTSAEYEKMLKEVEQMKYSKLTSLKKIFRDYTFGKSKHSRYNEGSADSLAILLLKKANIPFQANWLRRLDSTDNQYQIPLNKPIAVYFSEYGITLNNQLFEKKVKGLSAKNYQFKDTSQINDSLKTHPDCEARYHATSQYNTESSNLTPVPANIKELANKILIFNLFDNLNLTACLYRIFQIKDKGNTDSWYDFMLHNVFFGLQYSSRKLNRFNAIDVKPKEFICKTYQQLQTYLEQVPNEDIDQLLVQLGNCNYWQQLSADEKAFKVFAKDINLAFSQAETVKLQSDVAAQFLKNYPESMCCETANHFKLK